MNMLFLGTAHTIEVSPELMRMQMRAYLGAAVLQQENVLRIPHVYCESFETKYDNMTYKAFYREYTQGNVIFANDAALSKGIRDQFDKDMFSEPSTQSADLQLGKYVQGKFVKDGPASSQSEKTPLVESTEKNASDVLKDLEETRKKIDLLTKSSKSNLSTDTSTQDSTSSSKVNAVDTSTQDSTSSSKVNAVDHVNVDDVPEEVDTAGFADTGKKKEKKKGARR